MSSLKTLSYRVFQRELLRLMKVTSVTSLNIQISNQKKLKNQTLSHFYIISKKRKMVDEGMKTGLLTGR